MRMPTPTRPTPQPRFVSKAIPIHMKNRPHPIASSLCAVARLPAVPTAWSATDTSSVRDDANVDRTVLPLGHLVKKRDKRRPQLLPTPDKRKRIATQGRRHLPGERAAAEVCHNRPAGKIDFGGRSR
jgi:hypothetical protein